MYILGLQMGHASTAALMKDGRIIAAVSQERFDRKKNSNAFPAEPIKWMLDFERITMDQVDAVAVSGLLFPFLEAGITSGVGTPSIISKVWGNVEYKTPTLRKGLDPAYKTYLKRISKKNQNIAKRVLSERLKIDASKIHFVEHHVAHAYAAYYGMRNQENKDNSLVLTLDGAGDYYCAGVNTTDNLNIKRIASTPLQHSLGFVYSQTTLFLGMKPLEHEYKVMGLAPYAKDYYLDTYNNIFKPLIDLNQDNPLIFEARFPTNRTLQYLKDNAVGVRFDNISASVQHLAEDLMTRWVKAVIKKTGIKDVFCGGGVFMNVKANMKIMDIPEVEKLSVHPSCGDESNPFGAMYYLYINHFRNSPDKTKRIKDIYLGPEYSNDYIKEFIKKNNLEKKYHIEYVEEIEKKIAKMIADGGIVARLAGRAEWGARSLGNRAILGHPSHMETFYRVNDQIKMRDFWMPFAPTMLKERADEYIDNPKGIEAPYMILAFRSTEKGKKAFRAALHQGDHTLRPQVLEKSWNPGYYKIIKEFEKITGIGGILNTSFNLHGEPLVDSPADAIHTMENSGLQHLAMENYLISKKEV